MEESQEEQREVSAGHLIIYKESVPIRTEEPLSKQEIKVTANVWVANQCSKIHQNVWHSL
ncbi:hypothetical protein KY289_008379 [Solanum tuberosum]|nr:hypothetical protein KY289_008379 [Solanum tuberosum]